jgi:TonB-linked SusC/RagA family outer membrane protein
LLKNLQGATTISSAVEYNTVLKKIGYFGRVTYAYQDKYLFNASFRRDGSSVFGSDTKWGNFPAVSLGWNASDEDFLSGSEIVSLLKLRVSYGLTGNENFNLPGNPELDIWPYLALLQPANAIVDNGVVGGVAAANIANPDLQWEASKEFNPAIDFGFFNNRITGSLDYYVRTSDNLLLGNPVSYVTGFNTGIVNLGEVQNSGVEIELRSKNYSNNGFSWNSTIVASTNKNELLAFGESDGQITEDGFGRNSQWINSVGNPISSFYGYVVDTEVPIDYVTTPWIPINGTAQDAIVKDLNGDGIITEDDKTILGDPYAELVWSLTNEFKYGNFDMSVMIQGSQGAEIKNIGDQYFETQWQGATTSPSQMVADGVIPHTSFVQEKVLTNAVVQDAGYFSLRNINIGYTLPASLASKYGIENLRVYVSGQNLFYKTSSEYNGFNPEFIDTNNSPTAYGSQRAGTPIFRTMTLGLNVKF